MGSCEFSHALFLVKLGCQTIQCPDRDTVISVPNHHAIKAYTGHDGNTPLIQDLGTKERKLTYLFHSA